jgi:nicotinate phosphoribosyltransferase
MKAEALVTDLYQLTMGKGYTDHNKTEEIASFDLFSRKNPFGGEYMISAGLDKVVEFIKSIKFTDSDIEYLRTLNIFDEDYLESLRNFKFTGDVWAVPDGTIIGPNQPMLKVRAPLVQAQLLETRLINLMGYPTLTATNASRLVTAAQGRLVFEFGTRRAPLKSAAVEGAKYAIMGGVDGTSCVQVGKEYGVNIVGTMAHSWIESFDTEYEAFKAYAESFPDSCVLLVDTYDTLKSGVPNAIRVAKEVLEPMGKKVKGIRLDSGDLAYLSKKARKMLNDAGMKETMIMASNGLNAITIQDLIAQGAQIDAFGVGEKLINNKEDAVLSVVYKLMQIEKDGKIIPKIKLSENAAKTTIPGSKSIYRFYDKETGMALGDVMALDDEVIPTDKYTLVDPIHTYKQKELTNYNVKSLHVKVFENGEQVYEVPSLEESKKHAADELASLYVEHKRLKNPAKYYRDLSLPLLNFQKEMIEKKQNAIKTLVKKAK